MVKACFLIRGMLEVVTGVDTSAWTAEGESEDDGTGVSRRGRKVIEIEIQEQS
jgi:hypothetical protein